MLMPDLDAKVASILARDKSRNSASPAASSDKASSHPPLTSDNITTQPGPTSIADETSRTLTSDESTDFELLIGHVAPAIRSGPEDGRTVASDNNSATQPKLSQKMAYADDILNPWDILERAATNRPDYNPNLDGTEEQEASFAAAYLTEMSERGLTSVHKIERYLRIRGIQRTAETSGTRNHTRAGFDTAQHVKQGMKDECFLLATAAAEHAFMYYTMAQELQKAAITYEALLLEMVDEL
ncbi:hypothetical protein HWV62_40268 [Athelia sp. TMB]|nr:hypothetical protein HWV62_40268 [Athelia sp. TMB]